jgi:hypothetical protein
MRTGRPCTTWWCTTSNSKQRQKKVAKARVKRIYIRQLAVWRSNSRAVEDVIDFRGRIAVSGKAAEAARNM